MRPATFSFNDRAHFLLLSLLSFLILFVPLRRGDLSGYDDAVYAGQAKTMIQSGDWWNVRYNGALDFEKPPLFLWMEALSLSVFGLNDFAAKVPAALAGFGTIVLVYFLARELMDDPWLARLAMVVLLSTQYFMKYATHAMTDVPFTFFVTLTIFLYVKGLRAPRYFVWAGLPAAGAMLTRSVLGIIPIAIVLAHLAITGRYNLLFSRRCVFFLALAFFLPAAWVGIEYHLYGAAFLRAHASFVLGQAKAGKPWSAWNEFVQLLVYPKLLAQRYWPWLPFLLIGFYRQGRAAISQRKSSAILLLVWAFCVVGFFSVAEIKYLRYLLAAFPAFTILSASVLNGWIPVRRKIQLFQALYALSAIFVVYAALFPMTLLRATDMRQIGPVADANTSPQEHVLLYSSGAQDWGMQNQLLWYGNRRTELITDLPDLKSRLESGANSIVVIDKQSAERLRAAFGDAKAQGITVLVQSDNFSCLKYSLPRG